MDFFKINFEKEVFIDRVGCFEILNLLKENKLIESRYYLVKYNAVKGGSFESYCYSEYEAFNHIGVPQVFSEIGGTYHIGNGVLIETMKDKYLIDLEKYSLKNNISFEYAFILSSICHEIGHIQQTQRFLKKNNTIENLLGSQKIPHLSEGDISLEELREINKRYRKEPMEKYADKFSAYCMKRFEKELCEISKKFFKIIDLQYA